jgi:hypothetical protein
MAGSWERARETEEGDDSWDRGVSERESERARVRALLGWAALLGRAGTSARASRVVGPSQREEESARSIFLFFFFKNVNSISIYLFH